MGCATRVIAQNPVHWKYSSEKLADRTFQVHLTATIDDGWHVFSQVQPPDAVAAPSQIKFTHNPLIQLQGKIKEVGKREVYENREIGISAYQYAATLDFVQIVQLKTNAKIYIQGTIVFMACTNESCLPPMTVPFTLQLQ